MMCVFIYLKNLTDFTPEVPMNEFDLTHSLRAFWVNQSVRMRRTFLSSFQQAANLRVSKFVLLNIRSVSFSNFLSLHSHLLNMELHDGLLYL